MDLSNLKPAGKRKKRKRIGRGESSGYGKTAAKGHKGQKSRTSPDISPGFEGGQMPLHRRLPKKGFSNYPFRVRYNVVNVKDLSSLEPGVTVTPDLLRERRIVKKSGPIKLLAQGDVSGSFVIKLDRVSSAAKVKIEVAGGKVE
ncbi:MAG: 50S ribosomal protein L15 [Pseudomonadota bacterium]